jgi:putative endonuclease
VEDPSSRTAIGRRGEEFAASLLEGEGWKILARNYRAARGEVDIIALREGVLAFVEVKNWSVFDIEDLAVAISGRKRRRIVETSKIWLSRNREYSSARVRYDVLLLREGRLARRLESAFTGEL